MQVVAYMSGPECRVVTPIADTPEALAAAQAAVPGGTPFIVVDAATLPSRASRALWTISGVAVVLRAETQAEKDARLDNDTDRYLMGSDEGRALVRTLADILRTANPALTVADARTAIRQTFRNHLAAIRG